LIFKLIDIALTDIILTDIDLSC